MKVRMLISVSGVRNGQPWPERGAVAEFPDEEAAGLVHAGIAAELTEDEIRAEAKQEADEPPVEQATADKSKTETADKQTGLTTKTGPARGGRTTSK